MRTVNLFPYEWTLKDAKGDLYDFLIIEHTIGQAIADRDKRAQNLQEKANQENAEADDIAKREKEERDREVAEAYKADLDETERDLLNDYAEDLLRSAGDYKESFIDDFLVGLKENEIIREMMRSNFSGDMPAYLEAVKK